LHTEVENTILLCHLGTCHGYLEVLTVN